MKEQKFLIELLSRFTHKELFFGFWILMVAFFVYLILQFQKKREERNFKVEVPKAKNKAVTKKD